MARLWAWLVGHWLLGLRGGWHGLWFIGGGVAGHDFDVSTGRGTREQEALQGGGALDASVEVGENGGEVGGAEGGRDGGECGGGGAVPDGRQEMAAVAEQDANCVEHGCDVLGHGGAGLILWGIWRRGWTGCIG